MAEPVSILPILLAAIGLLLGSFFNVCIYRVPRDLSVAAPRSFCPSCGTTIAWYHNVPVVSFALLRGKCSSCGGPIAWRYPLVEVLTAVIFGLTGWRYEWTVDTFKWIVFESLLLILFWTDLEERLLPDEFTLGGLLAGFAFAFFVPVHSAIIDLLLHGSLTSTRWVVNAAAGALILSVPLWLFGWLYSRVRKREGLGFGDVKLLAFLGAFLGVDAGVLALMAGAIGGSIIGIGYILLKRKEMQSYELPFGSFLCAGAAAIPLVERLSGS